MEIKELSSVELKSICFNCLVSIEQSQNTLKIINQELASRAEKTQPITPNNMEEETIVTPEVTEEVVAETPVVVAEEATETPEVVEAEVIA